MADLPGRQLRARVRRLCGAAPPADVAAALAGRIVRTDTVTADALAREWLRRAETDAAAPADSEPGPALRLLGRLFGVPADHFLDDTPPGRDPSRGPTPTVPIRCHRICRAVGRSEIELRMIESRLVDEITARNP